MQLLFCLLCGVDLYYDTNQYEAEVLPFNSPGWEDSACVNWNGDQISFCYFQTNPLNGTLTVPAYGYTGHPQASDIYVATLKNGKWTVKPLPGEVNTHDGLEGCQHITPKYIYFSRQVGKKRALFKARNKNGVFTRVQVLPKPYNLYPELHEDNFSDNPFFYQGEIHYELSGDFYKGRKATELLSINSSDNESQFWGYGDDILFSRNHSAIFHKHKTHLAPIIAAKPGISLGEPSMDKHGNIYMIYVKDKKSDIIMLRKK